MSNSYIPYAKQSINESDLQSVNAALTSDYITRGPKVEDFEEAVANYCGAKYAVAFNSGTTALIASCHAAQVNSHDSLISSPNTFVASVTAGTRYGATPVFIDIDRETGNIDMEQLKINLKDFRSSRGRPVILPVHFSGIPVDMEELDQSICTPDAIVIEDAAHALGSTYKDGQKVGCCAWSQMTVFSFHPAKTITTGEGGMVTTNDADLYKRLRSFRNNGIERNPDYFIDKTEPYYEGYYEVQETSGNYNFTEFQAALGHSQLQRIESFIKKRRDLIRVYRQLLHDVQQIKLFDSKFDTQTAYHIFVVQIDFAAYNTTRGQVVSLLLDQGIGTQVHYIPVYKHPLFKEKIGDISSYFPKMEKYFEQALTLPLYYELSIKEVEIIVETLKNILHSEKQRNSKNYKGKKKR